MIFLFFLNKCDEVEGRGDNSHHHCGDDVDDIVVMRMGSYSGDYDDAHNDDYGTELVVKMEMEMEEGYDIADGSYNYHLHASVTLMERKEK